MEELEALRQWLQSFPGWGGAPLHIDQLQPQPENLGLFPLGEELLERREDLLGTVFVRCRQQFRLRRMVCAGEEEAARLLDFQRWVAQQSEAGLAPSLGEDCRFRAEQGRLDEAHPNGTAVYTVTVWAEFTRRFEG